ncbi:MAG: oligosaccharide flippase family protein [Novosphingobium sp.]
MSVRTAAIWAMVSQYASFAIQFIGSVVLARLFISPGQLGQFSIAFAAISLIAFLQDFGVNRFIGGEKELDRDKLSMAFTVSVVFAGGIAVIALLAAGPIARFYGDPQMLPVARVIAASYLLVPLAIVPQAMCQRRMDFRSNTMIEVGASLANVSVALVMAMRGQGALALAWGAFAQQAARMVVAQWRAGLMLPWPLHLRGIAPVLKIGGTNSVQSICGSIITRAPELVIGRLIDNAAVGLFARASGLALQLRLLLAGAVTGVFYPAFRHVRDKGEPLGPPYLRVVAAYTGITWPAMAGIAVLSAPLVSLLYGPRWMAAAPLLAWVAMAQLCYVAVPLNTDLPLLVGRMRGLIRCYLVETALSVLLLAAAAPFGLRWVAISRFVHGLLWIALYAPFMLGMLELRWRDLLKVYAQSMAATLAAVAPLIASYWLWQGPAEAGLVQVVCGTLCGIALWLMALRLLRHPLLAEISAILRDACAALLPRRAADTH